jgi:hypothetical protein
MKTVIAISAFAAVAILAYQYGPAIVKRVAGSNKTTTSTTVVTSKA